MTEEELEKELVERFCKTCHKKNNCFHHCDGYVYIIGYKQGQKDDVKYCESFCMKGGKIEQLKKENEYLNKVNNEQTEIILKLDEQIEKLTKMLDMAIDDIYNETLVIHRTREEFIDIYKSNLENKIMGN